MSAMPQESERRASPRKRALKKGVIAFQDRYCSAECTVRNESATGALLLVSQNQVIPNTFELKVHPEREFRVAEAIWRTPDEMGVRYVTATKPDMSGNWNGMDRRGHSDRRNGERRST